jgi:hypothetical protein
MSDDIWSGTKRRRVYRLSGARESDNECRLCGARESDDNSSVDSWALVKMPGKVKMKAIERTVGIEFIVKCG